jgi:hypothetical protein
VKTVCIETNQTRHSSLRRRRSSNTPSAAVTQEGDEDVAPKAFLSSTSSDTNVVTFFSIRAYIHFPRAEKNLHFSDASRQFHVTKDGVAIIDAVKRC